MRDKLLSEANADGDTIPDALENKNKRIAKMSIQN